MTLDNIIFKTIHGSKLYGLSHDDSDNDVFYVIDSRSRKAVHTQVVTEDAVFMGLDAFLERAMSGSHQSVEALFSPYKKWFDPSYRPMIESLRVTGGEVVDKYTRTIKKFSFEDFKRRRHAARLSIDLQSLRTYGKMNPVLTQLERKLCTKYAEELFGEELFEILMYGKVHNAYK